jgi:Flp pilus assembly protein CpaB
VSGFDRRRWRLVAGGTAAAGLLTAAIALAAIGPTAVGRAGTPVGQAPPVPPLASTPVDLQPRIADALPIGMRATTATFRDVTPKDAPLRAGDIADIVAIFRKDRVNEQTGLSIDDDTVALVRGLAVLAVSDTEPSVTTTAIGQAAAFRLRTFTVAASPEEAQLIALARQVGELRIGRCSTAKCDDGDLTGP